MSTQSTMELFPRPEACEDNAQDPAFWIEEVRLLKSFSPDTKEQIREPITFQKGLNIVWAPAPPMNQRKEINFAGHAAGKTTLCRLIRYLLGEHNTAAPGVKEAIEENFHDGWIIGKIHVSGQPWIVAKPLHHATRPRGRCIRSESLEELLGNPDASLPLDDFQKELTAVTIAPLPVALFGDGATRITFAHVIQWLARDQECHLAKLFLFRHPDSKSESPNLTAEAAHFLQRTILNLADKDLQEAITSCEKLEKEEKDLPTDKEYQIRREKELNQDLEDGRIKEKQSPLLTELLLASARRTKQEREEQTTYNTVEAIQLAKSEKKRIESELSALQEQLGGVKTNVTTAKAAEKEAKDQIDALNGKEFNLEAEKEKARKLPPSNYCRVPRELAEKCPAFCEWTVNTDHEDNKEDAITNSKRAAGSYLDICRKNLKALETEQARIEAKIKSGKSAKESIDTKLVTLDLKLKELKAPYATLGTKIDDLEIVIRKLAALTKREADLKEEVEKAKQLQEKLQQRHKDTEDKFVDEYAWTVAQIFGDEDTVTKCKFTREKITTTVTYNGKDLTSAAVTALQIFCFDIAAMTFSCRGRGLHPRFLLHDSPREADMGEAPYGRIFDHIIEQATTNPNFQHIITTTSNPPEEYQKLPYLRLKLDSATSDGKLFKRDL
jgi:hypothetical protein